MLFYHLYKNYRLCVIMYINFHAYIHIIKCDDNAQKKRVMIDFAWVENKKSQQKRNKRSLAKLDPRSVWRAPGRLGIGLIVINITSSYRMSVIIYTCFTELNRSYARPPRVGTRFGFILARYHPLHSSLSILYSFRSLIASSHRSPFRLFIFVF